MIKKISLMQWFIIFFIIEGIISIFFLGNELHFGKNEETGKTVWMEKIDEPMSTAIDKDIQPDLYVQKENIKHPEYYTYNSKVIYNFFLKWFGPKAAILDFRLYRMLLYLDIFFILTALFIRLKSSIKPSSVQLGFEMIYKFIDDLVGESMGNQNKHFTKFYLTIFLFIWISNWVVILPIPGISEPTRNLNVPLGMGLMSILLVHVMAIKRKGIVHYLKNYCEPMFFMAPLEIIGQLSKIVSLSFRLFGNIYGGSIITLVVSNLTLYYLVPLGLHIFFTIFVGTIQAFVFTMLSLTYLSIELAEE